MRSVGVLPLLALLRCTSPPTEVVVRFNTDLDPGTEVGTVRIAISRQGGTPIHDVPYDLQTPEYLRLPGEVSVRVSDPEDLRPFVIQITASPVAGVASPTVVREFVVSPTPTRTVVLDGWFSRSCASGQNDCGPDASCGRNGCEPSRRASLPELRTDVVVIAAGGEATCARRASGALLCWGLTSNGVDSPGPAVVAALSGTQRLAIGARHRCVTTVSDSRDQPRQALCWGDNELRQLGSSSTPGGPTPLVVEGLATPGAAPVELSAGAEHTCARLLGGVVRCWGDNRAGQLGDGTRATPTAPTAVAMPAGRVPVALTSGARHACALLSDGGVACWGANESGQLGDGTREGRTAPVMVQGLRRVTSVAAGSAHTCASRVDGTVTCWGDNARGQLGAGGPSSSPLPREVTTPFNAGEVIAGSSHTCLRGLNGLIACWGANDRGQIGDGTTDARTAPVVVTGADGVQQIAAGTAHTCALLATGAVLCWGDNRRGQIGDGTREDRPGPVGVRGLP